MLSLKFLKTNWPNLLLLYYLVIAWFTAWFAIWLHSIFLLSWYYSHVCFPGIFSLNPNLSELFRGSFWGWGGGEVKLPPCLKLVRIMLETSNVARKYTHLCSFRKYTFYYQAYLKFADASIFLQKYHRFLAKIVPLLKAILWELR